MKWIQEFSYRQPRIKHENYRRRIEHSDCSSTWKVGGAYDHTARPLYRCLKHSECSIMVHGPIYEPKVLESGRDRHIWSPQGQKTGRVYMLRGCPFDLHPIHWKQHQVANLPSDQSNSASYPQRDGKWSVAYLVWSTEWGLIGNGGMSAICTEGPSARQRGNRWMHNALRYLSWWQSAAISDIVERC